MFAIMEDGPIFQFSGNCDLFFGADAQNAQRTNLEFLQILKKCERVRAHTFSLWSFGGSYKLLIHYHDCIGFVLSLVSDDGWIPENLSMLVLKLL